MGERHKGGYLIFIWAFLFSVGYTIILVNGYYQYYYYSYIESGRQDLTVRLFFLSYVFGFLYYPTVILPILLLNWLTKNKFDIVSKLSWLYAILGVVICGLLFYSHVLDVLIYGFRHSWCFGLFLVAVSIYVLTSKSLRKKFKI